MSKKRSLPESPLPDDETWPRSREQDLAHFLDELAIEFRKDTSNRLPAFMAVWYIVAYWEESNEPPPPSVLVPLWAVQALADGFNDYRDSAQTIAPKTLGEAYKLEGGGQGKPRKIEPALLALRDKRISHAIASALANGVKRESALQEQADKTGLSFGQIEKIWGEYGERYINAVKNFPPA